MHYTHPKPMHYWARFLVAWLIMAALCVPLPGYAQDEPVTDTDPLLMDFAELPGPYADLLQALIEPMPVDADVTGAGTAGLMTMAAAQADIASQHTGFLQNAITEELFEEALMHTEHIVNILDGEDGDYFGDLDQDGQAQNPGDGVGVRVYLLDAETVAQELAVVLEDDGQPASVEFGNASLLQVAQSIDAVVQIQDKALEVLGTGSMEELTPVAQEMAGLIESLIEIIGEANDSLTNVALSLQPAAPSASADSVDLATLQSALDGELATIEAELASARGQLDIAIQHTGFLQNAITEANIDGARQHTEHIVNILDGEEGLLYGDLDQNGQTQNPGDGVGVLTYQTNAQAAAQIMVAEITAVGETHSLDPAIQQASGDIEQTIGGSVETVMSIQAQALDLIAASTIEEVNPIAVDMATLIEEATSQVTDSVAAHAALKALLVPVEEDQSLELQALVDLQAALGDDLVKVNDAIDGARGQLDIAIQHSGFLQDSLDDDNLDGSKAHAEHVTNIFEGQDSPAFGDLNGDGQTQNPGDGVGIRTYINDLVALAIPIQELLAADADPSDFSDGPVAAGLAGFDEAVAQLLDLAQLTPAAESEPTPLTDVTNDLLQLIVSTTLDEANPPAEAIRNQLVDTDLVLESLSIQSAALEAALTEAVALGSEADSVVALPPDEEAHKAVAKASEQLDIALAHVGLMNDALALDDLPGAKMHTEHVINVLEGENGTYYGELDGVGGIQNPGDGFGVRAYLDEALSSYSTLADDPDLVEQAGQIQVILADVDEVQQTLFPATELAYKIFAVDTTGEAQPFWNQVTERVSTAAAQMATTSAIRIGTAPSEDGDLVGMIVDNPPFDPSHGDEWTSASHGGTFVFMASGPTVIGADSDTAASPREQPAHDVEIAGFWIQQTETTNTQYGACVAAGACTPPDNRLWDEDDYATHPVQDVNWSQAATYAQWANARLPTEVEWEKACRGGDERLYPWGNDAPDETLANFDNNLGDTAPVGTYQDGATLQGLLDMSGNVWEWTSTLNRPYPYSATDEREDPTARGNRVVRGGSFSFTRYQASCIARTGFDVDSGSAGIRLVLLAKEGEWVNPADNARYVLVKEGEFIMGMDNATSPKEQPEHAVELAEFWIQKTETTNGQYTACVAAGDCSPPENDLWDSAENSDLPVTDVSWEQAQGYAAYVGGRLPTEAEWEKACRGTDGRLYPWGDDDPNSKISNYDNLIGEATAVGSYPGGASPVGALDMSGNVWEWTTSLDQSYPYAADDGRESAASDGDKIIMRGGSFYYTRYQVTCTARTGFAPDNQGDNFGFRVVVDNP